METITTPVIDMLSSEHLRALMKQSAAVGVSLFMPTEAGEPMREQNAVRLANLLRQAEDQLRARGLAPAAIAQLLAPAWQLGRDRLFMEPVAPGLAIFITPDLFRVYRLPEPYKELVVVDERLQIVPLLAMLQGDGQFFLLELGLNGAQLWSGTHAELTAMPLRAMPAGLKDALKYDEFAKQAQLHPGIPGRGGERGAIFHGQGARDDQLAKEEIQRYFQQVDRVVRAALHSAHAPLVLVGVGYLLPIYHAVNSYPHLLDGGIAYNPAELSHADLRARAWAIVGPHFDRERSGAAERYQFLQATQPTQATNYLRAIVPAASAGRVATLLVQAGQRSWGTFEPSTGVLALHAEAAPHDTELVNFAATQTLLHGGTVHIVSAALLPDADPLAAIFRY